MRLCFPRTDTSTPLHFLDGQPSASKMVVELTSCTIFFNLAVRCSYCDQGKSPLRVRGTQRPKHPPPSPHDSVVHAIHTNRLYCCISCVGLYLPKRIIATCHPVLILFTPLCPLPPPYQASLLPFPKASLRTTTHPSITSIVPSRWASKASP